MRLDRLSLGGVLRFTKPVTLDLTALPPGLIAVVGENGAGKTTLVEAGPATLFRQWPSRAERELVDYATSRDAYMEAVFHVEQRGSFRVRVNLDAGKRASDAIVEHTGLDGTVTVLNDGRLKTFDEAIATIFPPKDVLLASAVAAQNHAGSFVTLDKRGRKDLFQTLLGLDRFETMSNTARAAAHYCEVVTAELTAEGKVLAVDGATGIGATLSAQLAALATDIEAADTERASLAAKVAHLEHEGQWLHEQATVRAAAEATAEGVRRQLWQVAETRRQLDGDANIVEITKDRTLAAIDEAKAAELGQIQARLAANRKALATGAGIRSAAEALRRLEQETLAARERVAQLDADWRTAQATVGQLAEARLAAHQRLLASQSAAADAALLGDVPCGGKGKYAACGFLTRAVAAVARVPGAAADQAAFSQCLEADARAVMAAADAADALELAKINVTRIEQAMTAVRPAAHLLPKLDAAQARIAELEGDVVQVEIRADMRRTETLAIAKEAARRVVERHAELTAEHATLTQQLAEALAAVSKTSDVAATLARVNRALGATRAQLADASDRLTQAKRDRAATEHQYDTWQAKAEALGRVEGQVRTVETEWREWQLLTKALGRDGLPVLEIDAAGPSVSAYCNDLLTSCFGPRFTVELVTQAAKADGKGTKEVFELRVLDNERGGDARDLNDLSGGEQILVDEALKNALALFINARQAGAIETIFRDETSSALDPENALRYIDMLRRMRAIGGFHHVVFVSHNPAAVALADAQVRLADGRVSVHFPPFEEAA